MPTHKKIIGALIGIALIARLGIVCMNMQRHPAFFALDAQTIQNNICSGETPYMHPFGYEISNIAYALTCKGEGFASPFGGSTGPTGWVAPGIVFVYALAFTLFGCFTQNSVLCMFVLSCCLSTIMLVVLYDTARMLFNSKAVAYISAGLFAISPQDIWILGFGDQLDFNIYAFLLLINFFLFLRFAQSPTKKRLVIFSAVAGISLLFNPVFVFPITACLACYLITHRHSRPAALYNVCIAVLIIAILILPYTLYQKQRLGVWTFIKSNGPYEIALGNSHGYQGVLVYDLFQSRHPGSNRDEYRDYATMGEIRYIQSRLDRFKADFEMSRFMKLTIKRFLNFFFLFEPSLAPERYTSFRLLLDHISHALSGLSILIYLLVRYRKIRGYDYLVLLYIGAYAFPYMFAGIMPRYSFPICTLTTILLGKSIHVVYQARHSLRCARRVT